MHRVRWDIADRVAKKSYVGYILYAHGVKYPVLIGSDNSVGISTGFGAKGGYMHPTSKNLQKKLEKVITKISRTHLCHKRTTKALA